MIYWTNGSVIASVDVDAPTNARTIFEGDGILSIHTLSPGQQPQYCEYNIVVSCERLTDHHYVYQQVNTCTYVLMCVCCTLDFGHAGRTSIVLDVVLFFVVHLPCIAVTR